MSENILGIILAGVIGIIGTIVGASITTHNTRKDDSRRLLLDSYTEVISSHSEWLKNQTDETLLTHLMAIDKARLFCDEKPVPCYCC